jgi:hypothetical protein
MLCSRFQYAGASTQGLYLPKAPHKKKQKIAIVNPSSSVHLVQLLQLRLELAHRPLSQHDYNNPTQLTPFALRISPAQKIRHRPRGNPIHPCMTTIIGQTLPFGTPPISFCVEDVTAHLGQYTVWAYDVTKRDFVLGDIIHVCRQFHYTRTTVPHRWGWVSKRLKSD